MMRMWGRGKTIAAMLLLLMACAASPLAGAVSSTKERRADLSAMEEAVRLGVNEARAERRLAPLATNPALARIAREYSRRMAEEGFFSHYDPAGGSVIDRLREEGISYKVAGENIFRSRNLPDPVHAAIERWMASQGHRENILRPEFRETGVGIWKDAESIYFTQIFLKSP